MSPASLSNLPSQSLLSIAPNSFRSTTSSSTTLLDNVYQVDYTCEKAGKKLGMTKRRVRFRFGFADEDAILSGGKSGSDCRGEEHEITINWSLASGKQQVLCDGHEIHYEVKPREITLSCSWRFRGNHVLKVVGYAKPTSMRNDKDGTKKQFDVLLDGKSFFDFLPIYALGTKPSNQAVHRIDTKKANSFYNCPQTANTPSTVASSQSYESDETSTKDLLDMDETPATNYNTITPSSYNLVNDPFSISSPSPVETEDPEYQRRSKLAEINQNVMTAVHNTHASSPQAIVPSFQDNTASSHYADPSFVYSVPEPQVSERVDKQQEKPKDSLEDMFSRLVNVEDITEEPEHLQNVRLSMAPIVSSSSNRRSGSIPQPTLSEMKAISSSEASTTTNGKKEVMNSCFYQANTPQHDGALVVYGSSTHIHDMYSAPPLMRQVGFGVGATIAYQQQPQAQVYHQ